ncbi:MAG TPA: helix-turn-helix domain-containing protein [Rhodocyclaceae bacterium]|nr:helix-turn-helix domain-containing protein [Rhodocyclaceae bacterium]
MSAVHNSFVPVFALYGDRDSTPLDAEFIHIEDIESRSQLYGWEIDSHVHQGLFQVVFILSGKALTKIDDLTIEVGDAKAVIIPPATVHAFHFQPGTQGYVLTVAEPMLFEQQFRQPQVLDLGQGQRLAARVAGLLEHLHDEFIWPQPERTQMLELLVRTLLLLLSRQQAVQSTEGQSGKPRSELYGRFRQLLEAHFREQWSVQHFATALNATEGRLNRACRAMTGKSAFDLMQERLELEARRRLVYINAPVSLLAYELGFQDPAYFCRFFKKQTGMTPSEYRRQKRG